MTVFQGYLLKKQHTIISTVNTLIIDVRETSEIQATGLIKNAVNIPKSVIDANFDHSSNQKSSERQ